MKQEEYILVQNCKLSWSWCRIRTATVMMYRSGNKFIDKWSISWLSDQNIRSKKWLWLNFRRINKTSQAYFRKKFKKKKEEKNELLPLYILIDINTKYEVKSRFSTTPLKLLPYPFHDPARAWTNLQYSSKFLKPIAKWGVPNLT